VNTKNAAKWLIDFIESLPKSNESFSAILEMSSGGISDSGLRAIAGIYRSSGDLSRLMRSSFPEGSKQLAVFLEWEAPLASARISAMRNEPTVTFHVFAVNCLVSLRYCAAFIDDQLGSANFPDGETSEILDELLLFRSELESDKNLESSERDALCSACDEHAHRQPYGL
jgi:hypothetical protein